MKYQQHGPEDEIVEEFVEPYRAPAKKDPEPACSASFEQALEHMSDEDKEYAKGLNALMTYQDAALTILKSQTKDEQKEAEDNYEQAKINYIQNTWPNELQKKTAIEHVKQKPSASILATVVLLPFTLAVAFINALVSLFKSDPIPLVKSEARDTYANFNP